MINLYNYLVSKYNTNPNDNLIIVIQDFKPPSDFKILRKLRTQELDCNWVIRNICEGSIHVFSKIRWDNNYDLGYTDDEIKVVNNGSHIKTSFTCPNKTVSVTNAQIEELETTITGIKTEIKRLMTPIYKIFNSEGVIVKEFDNATNDFYKYKYENNITCKIINNEFFPKLVI
jgi:hypothetical protein